VHGDLTPWNIGKTVEGLRVFDWEYAAWEAAPLHDLTHYVIQCGALLGRHRPAEVVALLTAEGGLGWRHLERCGVDPHCAAELVRTYLVRAPQFGRKSMEFRLEVARWLP
jgi:hypothetical protein